MNLEEGGAEVGERLEAHAGESGRRRQKVGEASKNGGISEHGF